MTVTQAQQVLDALNTRPVTKETVAQLAAVTDLAVLIEVASTALRTDPPNSGWYLDAINDRLPTNALGQMADQAVRCRATGSSAAADVVIAYVSLHYPAALTAHLPILWELAPNAKTYHAAWPWRAADDSEIDRLLEMTEIGDGLAAERARRCLLETRRPEILTRLGAEEDDLLMVGYASTPDGHLTALDSRRPWHLAFPSKILDQWASHRPWRRHHPTWPTPSNTGPSALTSGFIKTHCPQCQHPLHRLLQLAPIPPDIGITTRARVEFVWCPCCSPYAESSFARHNSDGTPTDVSMNFFTTPPDGDLHDDPADWFIPTTEIELVRLDPRWWRQDWALSNDRQNLHRIGGEPTWIQSPYYPPCPDCTATMASAGQIAIADLWDAEGICYLHWCDNCAISAVVYQQT